MNNNIIRIIFLLSLFCAEAVMADPPSYAIKFPNQQNWKIGYEQKRGKSFIQEFVKNDESVQSWSEIMTIIYMEQPVRMNVETAVMRTIDGFEKGCPSFRHSVISENPTTIIFRWSDEGCGGWPAQEGVIRITAAENGAFSFQYAYLKNKASPHIDEWIQTLSDAKVIP
ncbi:MAG: hypothetical protein LBE33_11210 [Zoogloeaceae bacterium]|jgi:hypothetical protein|nr:hypothetical protein [Zoogloeaceae bacterium]